MTQITKQSLREKISEIKARDLIYPGIILFFSIIVLVLFSLATQFIANNLNKAFSGSIIGEIRTLNMENYILVAKKLGINTETKKVVGDTTPSPATSTPEEVTQPSLDKKELSLQVLNSTKKSGLAGSLAKTLEEAGWSKATTGNQNKLIPTTTVLIKESLTSFGPEILEEVKKIYPSATATTTAETAEFDIVIIIGTK